jgi:hypothetical protein
MQNHITISGKKIDSSVTRQIRNVMKGIGTRLWRRFLDARFLMLQLAGMATAQPVAVPVYRRHMAVGVTRRPAARMVFRHSHRAAGRSGGPSSGTVGGRL